MCPTGDNVCHVLESGCMHDGSGTSVCLRLVHSTSLFLVLYSMAGAVLPALFKRQPTKHGVLWYLAGH